MQRSTAARNAAMDSFETLVGASPIMRLLNTLPANCAAADSTVLAQGTLPADWLANAASGAKAQSGVWALTGQAAAGGGTVAAAYRIYDSGGTTCHEQGTVFEAVAIATSATTGANDNLLTFADTTGVVVGMKASGTGVVAGSKVLAVTGTTVKLSKASTAGVGSGVTITFGGDMTISDSMVATGQNVVVSGSQYSAGNA